MQLLYANALYCVCMAAFITGDMITDWIDSWMGPYQTPFIIGGLVVLAIAVGWNEWRSRRKR